MNTDSADSELDSDGLVELAERLRVAKLKGGYKNDVDFAIAAGVARSSMSAYLNAKQRPKASTLHHIASITGVDLNWLLGTNAAASAPIQNHGTELNCALLTREFLDSPVNFNLLVMGVAICQEHFKNEPKPTLRQALDWIAGPYALHARIPDAPVKLSA